ncbi:MAG: FAD-dependent oxidoreductase, partial [Thermoguttaceae bacterium]|nr:FAD-dependent oxidoreductase [Thermoguttaceae bacterium]
MKKRIVSIVAALFAAASLIAPNVKAEEAGSYDVVVYGGTCAAVTSAVQVKKMGKTVVVVSPDKHLGGLSSGGL